MGKHMVVSAAEANRSFSKLLRAVREGKRVTITSHGTPVAEMGPVADSEEQVRRETAWKEIKARWAQNEFRVIGPWSRDDIYDEVTR